MLDLKRYKRFFAFGCSFTNYMWPTWADIIATEMSHAEYGNFGISGSGNETILCRVVEADKRFQFNTDDLIMIMWTTMCREDRWVGGSWKMTGNIFNQFEYDENFVTNFADPKGYLIKNMAVMSSTRRYVHSTNASLFTMTATPFDHQQNTADPQIQGILDLYSADNELVQDSLFEVEMDNEWGTGCQYLKNQTLCNDYHPTPIRYYNYLLKLGFVFSNDTYKYVMDAEALLKRATTEVEIREMFDFSNRDHLKYQML
jgi:hypothetical protein